MAHSADEPDLDELCDASEDTTEAFAKAAEHLKTLVSKLDNDVLLDFYGYYKQGIEGPCNTPKPGWFNVSGKAKWDAWKKLGNMSRLDAQTRYVQLMEKVDPNFLSFSGVKRGWVAISTMQPVDEEPSMAEKCLVDYVKDGNMKDLLKVLKAHKPKELPDLLNNLDGTGLAPIHWAADRGFPAVLEAIISYGADVNLADSDGQTALHYAASCGHVDCIKVLLKNNADVNLKDSEGSDPKTVASDQNVVDLLNSV